MKRANKPWRWLEAFPTQAAVLAEWNRACGPEFEMARAFLLPTTEQSTTFPCTHPFPCECEHRVVVHSPERIVACCQCEEGGCRPIPLQPRDLLVYKFNAAAFCGALARALKFEPAVECAIANAANVWRVGTYPQTHSPVFFSACPIDELFQENVERLVSMHGEPFVLIAPSERRRTAVVQGILQRERCEFIPLSGCVALGIGGGFAVTNSVEPILDRFAARLTEGSGLARTVGRYDRNSEAVVNGNYQLRKEHGVWVLVFDGKPGSMDDEKGLYYVSYLLKNPPKEPIHASELAAKAFGDAVVENQRNLAADDTETLASMRQARREWQAVLDDDEATEIDKREAEQKLSEIDAWARKNIRGTEGNEQRQVRAIRQAIRRLIDGLAQAKDESRGPHKVLREFGQHLEKHLWIPSSRANRRRKTRVRAGLAGRFTYEPPPGITWVK